MDEERLAWLNLKLIPDLGNRSLLRLLKHFGTAQAILRAGPGELAAVGGLRDQGRLALMRKTLLRPLAAEWEKLHQAEIRLLCLPDSEYPANLAAIPDPPVAQFV